MAKIRYFLHLFILCLLLVPSVSAMGIGGKKLRVTLDYQPGLEYSQTYQLITTSEYTQDYEVYLSGDLSGYVTLEPDHFEDVKPGSNPYLKATLKLPAGIDKELAPGTHKVHIGMRETISPSGGAIGVITGAEAIIEVRFLYPGKYLSATLKADDVEVNDPVNLKVHVRNGGKEDLKSVRAKIDIYDYQEKNVGTVYTGESSLKSTQSTVLYSQFSTNGLKSGQYKAVATVYYDGLEINAEDRFKIGSLELRIVDYTKEVPAGKIHPFEVDVQSRWNNIIPNVYASVKIGKQTFETPTATIKPWETKSLTGYLDTTNMPIGEYDAEITVYYAENMTKETGKVTVTEPGEGMPAPAASTSTVLLVSIIILLVIINLLYVFFHSKKNKKKQDELEMLIREKLKSKYKK